MVEKWGGRVLIDAPVGCVSFDEKTGAACGVVLEDGTEVEAPIVVSACGYLNTFRRLVPREVCERFGVPRELPQIAMSAGFIMGNFGIAGTAEELGVTNTNTWFHPVSKDGDFFEALRAFFDDPSSTDPPAMLTFPSVKDTEYAARHPGKTSCQVLILADSRWFAAWRDEPTGSRGGDYDDLKQQWRERMLRLLYRFYPKCEGRVEVSDVSTPLSIEHYLRGWDGGAVGLDVTPPRFFDWNVVQHLHPVTRVPGLYLTGHDCMLPGVVMAQMSGVITGFRIAGFVAAMRMFLQSLFLLPDVDFGGYPIPRWGWKKE